MPRSDTDLCASLAAWLVALLGISLSGGCASQFQKPSNLPLTNRPIASPDSLQLVRDLARPWGTKWIEVEGVTLAVGLNRTGSDPPPNTERGMLLKEMQVREVENPDSVLASPDTALVMVRALIPPGAQKGDRLDLEVRVPARSETTSLQGGWAMLSRLREFVKLNRRLSQGNVLALGQGDILIDSIVEGSSDPVLKTRGKVLGGAVVSVPRELGLIVRDEHLSVRTSAAIGEAINGRFHIYSNGDKQGVATPRRDTFISLAVHPRYRDNLTRYIRVIQNIPVREKPQALSVRLQALGTRLLQPVTASEAAVQLESVGVDAIPVLKDALRSKNMEVRFYAAEALAYLDEPESAAELADAIRYEPAFRWRAFRALGAMDQLESQEELAMLFHEESAETRYGAFQTLRKLEPDDPIVKGETVGTKLRLHRVSSTASPYIHIAKAEYPEIVMFGEAFRLMSPVMIFAGNGIVIKNTDDGRLRVRKLSAGNHDQEQLVEQTLAAMIRAIVDLGGGYTDVVQAITEARDHGSLDCKVAFSAIPKPGRRLDRDSDENADGPDEDVAPDDPSPASGDLDDQGILPPANEDETDDETMGLPSIADTTGLDEADLEGLLLFDDDPDHPAAVIDQLHP